MQESRGSAKNPTVPSVLGWQMLVPLPKDLAGHCHPNSAASAAAAGAGRGNKAPTNSWSGREPCWHFQSASYRRTGGIKPWDPSLFLGAPPRNPERFPREKCACPERCQPQSSGMSEHGRALGVGLLWAGGDVQSPSAPRWPKHTGPGTAERWIPLCQLLFACHYSCVGQRG